MSFLYFSVGDDESDEASSSRASANIPVGNFMSGHIRNILLWWSDNIFLALIIAEYY